MDIQWIKFGIMILMCISNIILGIYILKRNIAKQKFIKYFALICINVGIWSLSIGASLLINNIYIYKYTVQVFYISATLIFIFFLLFSEEYIYKFHSKNIFRYLTLTLFVILITVTLLNQFCIDTYRDQYGLHEIENKTLHLIYGFYILSLLIYSYFILIKKYISSNGINKKSLKLLILGTSIPFIAGIYFDWYMQQINMHYLYWIGPIFTSIMNFSIAYLLFKKK